jgi:hypothetical protein
VAPSQKGNPPPAEADADETSKRRYQMTINVSSILRDHILESAEQSGRSQSQTVEYMLEQMLAYDRVLTAMKATIADARKYGVEKIFRDAGFVPVKDPVHGTAWVPLGFPGLRASFTGIVSDTKETK